jgi:hypothetical protein
VRRDRNCKLLKGVAAIFNPARKPTHAHREAIRDGASQSWEA